MEKMMFSVIEFEGEPERDAAYARLGEEVPFEVLYAGHHAPGNRGFAWEQLPCIGLHVAGRGAHSLLPLKTALGQGEAEVWFAVNPGLRRLAALSWWARKTRRRAVFWLPETRGFAWFAVLVGQALGMPIEGVRDDAAFDDLMNRHRHAGGSV